MQENNQYFFDGEEFEVDQSQIVKIEGGGRTIYKSQAGSINFIETTGIEGKSVEYKVLINVQGYSDAEIEKTKDKWQNIFNDNNQYKTLITPDFPNGVMAVAVLKSMTAYVNSSHLEYVVVFHIQEQEISAFTAILDDEINDELNRLGYHKASNFFEKSLNFIGDIRSKVANFVGQCEMFTTNVNNIAYTINGMTADVMNLNNSVIDATQAPLSIISATNTFKDNVYSIRETPNKIFKNIYDIIAGVVSLIGINNVNYVIDNIVDNQKITEFFTEARIENETIENQKILYDTINSIILMNLYSQFEVEDFDTDIQQINYFNCLEKLYYKIYTKNTSLAIHLERMRANCIKFHNRQLQALPSRQERLANYTRHLITDCYDINGNLDLYDIWKKQNSIQKILYNKDTYISI